MFGLFSKEKPPTNYNPVVMAQAAQAMELYGASPELSPTVDREQAVASAIGECATIILNMAQHATLAQARGLINAADPVIQSAMHNLNVAALSPAMTTAAMFNEPPVPPLPLANLILTVTRDIMQATKASQYPVTPTKALVDTSAMPTMPTHVIVDNK
jgi:hypothetical protein